MRSFSTLVFAVTVFRFQYATAQAAITSLYLPGLDAQPLSADFIGVDTAQARTTWAVQNPPGTPDDDEGLGGGVITLIEGSDFVRLELVITDGTTPSTLLEECSISGSIATCVGSFMSSTTTEFDTVTLLPVALGTAPPATGATPSVTPAPTSVTPIGPSSTPLSSTGGSSTSPSSSPISASQSPPLSQPTSSSAERTLAVSSLILAVSASFMLGIYL